MPAIGNKCPWAKGKVRGHGIAPLYSSVPEAAGQNDNLYELLALADALRIGRARERDLAVNELKKLKRCRVFVTK